ncbi:hypothetical protein NL108_010329 [Boleophthalmus pectinirostris]|nr:hypothetical protein NL108_010329 [Boleophthalmus pectinirostris]
MLTVRIKKKSRVPGVMITQFVETLPEGMSTPDFTRKPIALTLQEGKQAIFRAIITGNPTPTVTWARNNGEIDEENYVIAFDKSTGEHQLQLPALTSDQADTYKCFARNEYGTAVVTATLNVIEAIRELPDDFKKGLRNVELEPKEEPKPEIDEKFWELLMSADKKDYEKICAQYGVTDFRGMLKKLNEKKEERQKEQERVVERLCNLKPVELRDDGNAEFELEMSLKDPTSKIFLYKDGVMVPFDADTEIKHGLKQVGKKFVFSINGVNPEDAGLYQVEVDGIKVFSTDLKRSCVFCTVPGVEFLVKIQDVHAEEREDAIFECVLSQPMSKITWMGNNKPLEQGEKFDIMVSEDMLIHSLLVKDCFALDKGIYVASEQNAKVQAEREVLIAKVKAEAEAAAAAAAIAQAEAEAKAKAEAEAKAKALAEAKAKKAQAKAKAKADAKAAAGEGKEKKAKKKVEAKEGAEPTGEEEEEDEESEEEEELEEGEEPKPKTKTNEVYFTCGLSDVTAIIGTDAELVCRLNTEDCDGVWYKEGIEITSTDNLCIVKDGTYRKLIVKNCKEEDAGKFKYEADGRKTEALLKVEDPPRFNPEELEEYKKPVVIKTGKGASFEVSFVGREPLKIQWFNEGEELIEDSHTKIEKSSTHTRLVLTKCNRKISGEIKVKIKNECGVTEATTNLLVLAYPGAPSTPKIVSAFKDCINLAWNAPSNTGGTDILGYNVEKRRNGSNRWDQVNPPNQLIREKNYGVKDVVEGFEYEFRVSAVNISGAGEPSTPSEFVFARDPKKPPGKVIDLKVTDSTYTTLSLGWTKPIEDEGVQDEAKGYFVELRPAENPEWSRCNSSAIIVTSYTIMGLKSMAMYWVRVVATNEGGDGEAQELDNYIIAMPPPGK